MVGRVKGRASVWHQKFNLAHTAEAGTAPQASGTITDQWQITDQGRSWGSSRDELINKLYLDFFCF